ncbi:SDR family NAD(P)-dependent oxidoreductase [Serinibacter salmoneus]|uniref:NAD(P)-dependent dehydrogenase (Short-subunit alcohol dehydrogenase family) n=1 Tax=Serinibacter salmoneus TaxID=556530 RepID=A0A2A9D3D7_9MICO|nr:SDR family NAD(P)-dependent oxidoreductase [Serinibacter salmoneus]PFG21228.1 NAD(P)-dependent dehydrogenase (short-subunit alcohol dehydrogenase family) [Serinibacter salmoneus]
MSRRNPPAPVHYDEVVSALPALTGLTVAVTGATSGTGYVLAETVGRLGARVVMVNRPSARADAALGALRVQEIDAHLVPCDLQSFASVRAAAPLLAHAAPNGLDVLANNAGVMALPDRPSGDGCDVQMQVNHLSHALLTSLAWPLLRAAARARGESRVVFHSSGARRGAPIRAESLGRTGGSLGGDGFLGTGKWRRYQQSKLANLLFSYALAERVPADSPAVKSLCAHPGPTATDLLGKAADAGAAGLLDRAILGRTRRAAHAAPDGALGLIMASLLPGADSGEFYGPPGMGKAGLAALLPPERDRAAEELVWSQTLTTIGVRDFFGR